MHYVRCEDFIDAGLWDAWDCCAACHEAVDEGWDEFQPVGGPTHHGHLGRTGPVAALICCEVHRYIADEREAFTLALLARSSRLHRAAARN